MGTAWTDLLREVIEDDARTARAQRLATTFTWCAMGLLAVVLVTVLTVAAVVYGAVGWVPLAGGGGTLTVLGIATRLFAVRRRRRLNRTSEQTTLDEEPRVDR
jgi:hypothetical protein